MLVPLLMSMAWIDSEWESCARVSPARPGASSSPLIEPEGASIANVGAWFHEPARSNQEEVIPSLPFSLPFISALFHLLLAAKETPSTLNVWQRVITLPSGH